MRLTSFRMPYLSCDSLYRQIHPLKKLLMTYLQLSGFDHKLLSGTVKKTGLNYQERRKFEIITYCKQSALKRLEKLLQYVLACLQAENRNQPTTRNIYISVDLYNSIHKRSRNFLEEADKKASKKVRSSFLSS